MTALALNTALELLPAAAIAEQAGCTRQAVVKARRDGFVKTGIGSCGVRIADAIELLTDGKVSAASVLELDPTPQPQPAKRPGRGDRAMANAASRQTWKEKRADAGKGSQVFQEETDDIADNDGATQSISARRRVAEMEKIEAQARLAEENLRKAKMELDLEMGKLLDAEVVKQKIIAAAIEFTRARDGIGLKIDEVACSSCRNAVYDSMSEVLTKLRQDVVGAMTHDS